MAGKTINSECLKKLQLFETASLETLKALSNIMEVVNYPKGKCILNDKEQAEHLYIVLSGTFIIYKISDTGDRRVIFIQGAGVLLNDNLSPTLPNSIYAESFEDASVLICPKDRFLSLMSQDFNLTQEVLDQFSSKLRRTYRQLKNTPTNISVEKKLAAKLYALSRDYGIKTSAGILIDLQLSVNSISEMIGTQRETISRALKKLVQKGLIIYEQKKILIPDLDEVVRFYKNL